MDNENKTTGEQNGENSTENTQNGTVQTNNIEQVNKIRQTDNTDFADSHVSEALPKYIRQKFDKYPILDGRTYSYEEYNKWDCKEGERWELHDGIPVKLEAAEYDHVSINSELHGLLWSYIKNKRKKCKVFFSLGVKIDAASTRKNAFIPDITVVCNKDKFDNYGCNGAPDLVMEILSPSTSKNDKTFKYTKYEQEGVPEYWIIDPKKKLVTVNILTNGKYIAHPYTEKDKVKVHIFDGCIIDLAEVFEE